jgi:hypothetical protein
MTDACNSGTGKRVRQKVPAACGVTRERCPHMQNGPGLCVGPVLDPRPRYGKFQIKLSLTGRLRGSLLPVNFELELTSS